jgi:hypothetical protein
VQDFDDVQGERQGLRATVMVQEQIAKNVTSNLPILTELAAVLFY